METQPPALPDAALANDPLDPRNLARGAGSLAGAAISPNEPMGTWTGLHPMLGAPLSGALWGAGLGAAYHGLKPLVTGKPHKRKHRLIDSVLAGTGIGSLVGAGSGALLSMKEGSDKRAAADLGYIVQSVMKDPTLTEREKQQILRQLSSADNDTLRRIVAAAMGGGLTGVLVARLLGFRGLGSALAGIAGAGLAGNFFRGPQAFV